MSIVGGYFKAVEAAAAHAMDCVQIFTKNSNQWKARPLVQSEIDEFRAAVRRTNIRFPVAHDSYLINLASPDDALWKKSIDAFTIELERAEALGLMGVVTHPGAYVDSSEDEGLARIIEALDEAHRRTAGFRTITLLETTAGQGSCLGHQFDHLADIANDVAAPERVGICVDTCHIFAAGYAIGTKAAYAATIAELHDVVGLDRVRAFHLNDSVRELGSRVDRHARIGAGKLGLEPFRLLLNDRRFAGVPMYLETPKGEEAGESLDAINLRTLRGLIKKRRGAPRAGTVRVRRITAPVS